MGQLGTGVWRCQDCEFVTEVLATPRRRRKPKTDRKRKKKTA